MFRKLFTAPLIAAVSLLVMACSDGSSSRPLPTPDPVELTAVNFEVLHASQDAPPVNVAIGSAAADGLDYGQSYFVTTTAGSLDVQVDGIIPGGNATVIGPATLDTNDGERITIIAANAVADIEPLILVDEQPAVDPAEVRVRIVHAASIAPMVDVYVTDTTTDITTVAPVGTFSFRDVLGPLTVPAGEYRIRVTPAGDPATVVFDSGAVELPGGGDLVVAAIVNVATGESPIELAVLTGSAALRLVDSSSTADVRVVHASSDAPPVDVVANDNFAAPAVVNLAFTEVTDFLNLAPGDINVKVVPTGTMAPVVIGRRPVAERGYHLHRDGHR